MEKTPLQIIFETKRKKMMEKAFRGLQMCDSDPSKSKTEMNGLLVSKNKVKSNQLCESIERVKMQG